jgi:hypothetical protein
MNFWPLPFGRGGWVGVWGVNITFTECRGGWGEAIVLLLYFLHYM